MSCVQIQCASDEMLGRSPHGGTPLSPASPAAGQSSSLNSAVSQPSGGSSPPKDLHFQWVPVMMLSPQCEMSARIAAYTAPSSRS